MINYEKLITADPMTLTRLLCHMNALCNGCPAYHGDHAYNQEFCRKELYSWLMGQEDERYWEGRTHE